MKYGAEYAIGFVRKVKIDITVTWQNICSPVE
jgi:hypothetical protein